VRRAPGIPHALCFWGEYFLHNSGASRREGASSRRKIMWLFEIRILVRSRQRQASFGGLIWRGRPAI
jgi:hypothetical protein